MKKYSIKKYITIALIISIALILIILSPLILIFFLTLNWSEKREIKTVDSDGYVLKTYREEVWRDNANYTLVVQENFFGINSERTLYKENCYSTCLTSLEVKGDILTVILKDGEKKTFNLK